MEHLYYILPLTAFIVWAIGMFTKRRLVLALAVLIEIGAVVFAGTTEMFFLNIVYVMLFLVFATSLVGCWNEFKNKDGVSHD